MPRPTAPCPRKAVDMPTAAPLWVRSYLRLEFELVLECNRLPSQDLRHLTCARRGG
jgi:hypothetical protein